MENTVKHIIYNSVINKIKKRIRSNDQKDEWRMYTPYLLKYLDQCDVANIVPKKSCNVVFVEFRELNYYHIKFILLNAYKKLGKNFMYTIVCGNLNYEFMERVNKDIGGFNKILRFNINHCPVMTYNVLFFTESFWEKLDGEKILIYQDDSIIYNGSLLNNFMDYDYVGSPWPDEWKNNTKNVGNGGLSFRTKATMLKALKEKIVYTFEDIFFSRIIIDYDIGLVPETDVAKYFSMASVYTPGIDMFGGHMWWTALKNRTYKFDYCFSSIFKSVLIVCDNNICNNSTDLINMLDFFVLKKYIIMLGSDNATKKLLTKILNKKYYNFIKYVEIDYLEDEHFTVDLKVDYFVTMGLENRYIKGLGKENICYLDNYDKKVNRPSYDLYIVSTEDDTYESDDDTSVCSDVTLDELLYENAIDTYNKKIIVNNKPPYKVTEYIDFLKNIKNTDELGA